MTDKQANRPGSDNEMNRSGEELRPRVVPGATALRLSAEMSDLEAAIELVASGAADRVTLSGLRFGEQLLVRFTGEASEAGLVLEPIRWLIDEGADIMVRRVEETRNG